LRDAKIGQGLIWMVGKGFLGFGLSPVLNGETFKLNYVGVS